MHSQAQPTLMQLQNVGHSNYSTTQAEVLSLTPKKETKAWDFIRQNPTADGRGVVIAILDTGVDPGAPGLSETSHGKVKVIERYDCTGAGDVDTSTITSAIVGEDGSNIIQAWSGRNLKIPAAWNNPNGKFHIGFKPVFELYPSELLERMQAERRKLFWEPQQRICLRVAEEALEVLTTVRSSSLKEKSLEERFAQEEVAAKFDMLTKLDANVEDLGPILDCILFQDDRNVWQICLSLGCGEGILLREYNFAHEYSSILPKDRFNISVNVWDGGNLLEIVGMSDSHGTHVAAIAAANFPCSPELNGVAPGAQIVSLTIGDNRLESQETAAAVARAMARAMKNPRIHVINMSYGEQSMWAPCGRIAKLMCKVVDEQGIVWVCAAGNAGPCLSTVDSPCWICDDCIIGVGAYVSPDMMPILYSHREKKPGMSFTWSSRGPAPDGGLCVNVSAPGGAITSVPNYTLMGEVLMQGTSMASPHCAGCVALLISKAIQKNLAWTPYSIKRSLENTAIDVAHIDHFGQGAGLIQIPAAFQLMEYLAHLPDKFVRFNISCSGGRPGLQMRGIYVRSPPLEHPKEFEIGVQPVFFNDEEIGTDFKIAFKKHMSLLCNAAWLQIPKFLEVQNSDCSFAVLLNPMNLLPGVHYARIDAVDTTDLRKGPMFSVDITVIVPIQLSYDPNPWVDFGRLTYGPGDISRFFIRPPDFANYAVLSVKTIAVCCEGSYNKRDQECPRHSLHESSFYIQSLTINPGQIPDLEDAQIVQLYLNEERTFNLGVEGGKILEIVIARGWEESETVTLISSLRFRGIAINKPLISVASTQAVVAVELNNHFTSEDILPKASLTHLVEVLRATEINIRTLTSPREEIAPGNPIYELQAMYEFTVFRDTEILIECPLLCEHLYESEFQSQLWMIFDTNKRYICGGDAFPKRFQHSLKGGHYVLRIHIRHNCVEALHNFIAPAAADRSRTNSIKKNIDIVPLFPVHIKMALPRPVRLKIWSYFGAAICDRLENTEQHDWTHSGNWRDAENPLTLRKNEFVNCYIRVLLTEEDIHTLPSYFGFYMEGTFNYSGSQSSRPFYEANLKVFIPGLQQFPRVGFGRSSFESGGSGRRSSTPGLEAAFPNELTPEEIYRLASTDFAGLKKDAEIESVIDYLFENSYFALAVKALDHKREIDSKTWNSDWNSKLRECYVGLGWTHCVFYLDTNWLVGNPPDYRAF